MAILPKLGSVMLLATLAGCIDQGGEAGTAPDAAADVNIDIDSPVTPDEPAPREPREDLALGAWELEVDRAPCSDPAVMRIKIERVDDLVVVRPDRAVAATGVRLFEAGGEVLLAADGEEWRVTLRDDGTYARALVGWSDGLCEISGEALVRTRER